MAKDIIIDPSELKPENNNIENNSKRTENNPKKTETKDIVIDPVELQSNNTPKKEDKWFWWEVWDVAWSAWKWIKEAGSAVKDTIENATDDAIEKTWLWVEAAGVKFKNIPVVWDVMWNALQDFWSKLTNEFSLKARKERDLEDEYKDQQEQVKQINYKKEREKYIDDVFKKYFTSLDKNKTFEVNSNSLSTLKGYIEEKAQDEQDLKDAMLKTEWDTNLYWMVWSYYKNYKGYMDKLYQRMWELIGKKRKETGGKVSGDDMKKIFDDDKIKDYAYKAKDNYKIAHQLLNGEELYGDVSNAIDKFKNLDILWWLKNTWIWILQWIENGMSSITYWWEKWLTMWLKEFEEASKWMQKWNAPIISQMGSVIHWVSNKLLEAQYDLWDFASRIKGSEWSVLHNIDYIWTNVLWFTKYIPWLFVWLGSIWKAGKLYWKTAKALWASSKVQKAAEVWWWMFFWTDLTVDWVVNYWTNTHIDDKQVAADYLYNILFGAAISWMANWYKFYKEWLNKKAEEEFLNTVVDVPFLNKDKEPVKIQIKVWDYFKSPGEVIRIARAKWVVDLNLFKKLSNGVKKKVSSLADNLNEKEQLKTMKQFNLQVAKFFGDDTVLENVNRINKTKTGTKQMYGKMMNVLDDFIKSQAKNIDEAEQQVDKLSAYKAVRDSFANKKAVYDYLQWLDNISIKIGKNKTKKIEMSFNKMSNLNKIEFDKLSWIERKEFTNKVLNDVIKNYNEQIFKDSDNIPLSSYLEWLKKVLWWAVNASWKDLKNLLNTNVKVLDKFEKIIKRISTKNQEYKIWKTNKWNALARAEIANKLIKLNNIHKDFKNPEDFLVVLIHELTHLTENWLKEIWGEKLVSNVKKDWYKVSILFKALNWKTVSDIRPFNTKKEITEYIDNISKPEAHISDDIVDFNIKLSKTINDKVISNADRKEYLSMFLNSKKNLLESVKNNWDLEQILREFNSFVKQSDYAKQSFGIDINAEDYIKQYKDDIVNKIIEKYNIQDRDIWVVKYHELLREVSNKYDPLIRDLWLKRMLYEITSNEETTIWWVKWFSEYLSYILSEKLVKWEWWETLEKITKMIGINDYKIEKHINEAADKILNIKYKELVNKDIEWVKKVWKIVKDISKDKDVIKRENVVIHNFQELLKYPSADNLLELVDNLDKNQFNELIAKWLWYNKKDIEEVEKVLWFEKTKRYIWNDILLWITGKDWIISWWLWEWISKDKDINGLKYYIKDNLLEYIWEGKNVDAIKKALDPKGNININTYYSILSGYIENGNGHVIWAVWKVLDKLASDVWKATSKTIDDILKLSFLSKEEKSLLKWVRDLYDAYENEKLLQVFKSFNEKAVSTLLTEIDNVKEIEKNILTKNRKTKEEFVKEIRDLIGKIWKKWIKNLGYIFRVWKSWWDLYKKINLTKVNNIWNISVFHNIVNKLWYKNSDLVVPSFIEKVKAFWIKKWLLQKNSSDTNFIFNLYWYEFKWTVLQLNELTKKVNLWIQDNKDIGQILEEVYKSDNKLWLIKTNDKKNLLNNDILNSFFFNPKNNDKYEEVLKKWNIEPEDYIDVLYDIFKPNIAKDITDRLVSISTEELKKQWTDETTITDYINRLSNYSQKTYDTVSNIDKEIENALGDVKSIDVMTWKYTDIPVWLQRYNAYYSSIWWTETLSITNKQWIVFQLEKNKKWKRVIKSKINANSSYLDKESPLSSTISKSELDFEEQINNITNIISSEDINKFINNCL